ncbi:hypothetical protein EC527_07275 [Helicobacter pylori]|nr:hypothetical protein EC527_07275 [Helicobacter pylori]
MSFIRQSLTIVLPPNETKSVKIKKITKFSPNDKKKKTLYAIILQIHSNSKCILVYEILNTNPI